MDDLTKGALLALAVGALFAGIGVAQVVRTRRFRERAVRVPGVVTDLVWSSSSDGGGVWYPVLSFSTAEGRPVLTRGRTGRSPAPARRGQHVEVLYDPADPAEADLPRSGAVVLGCLFVVIGSVAAVVGAGLLLAR